MVVGDLAKRKKISYIDLIKMVQDDVFVLPEIQRRFVWDLDRIAELWDSIFHGFPIGQLLFWVNTPKLPFYDFRDNSSFESRYLFVNKKPNWYHDSCASSTSNKIVVLDGQQRITSLFLGMSEDGISAKSRKNSAVVKKCLSIYVGDGDASGDNDIKLFAWKEKDSDKDYISIADALKSRKQHKNIHILKERLSSRNSNTVSVDYLDGKGISEVVEIFRRLNNGGVKMNNSELYLAMWLGSDDAKGMREKLEEFRSAYGVEFNVQDSTITQLLNFIFEDNYSEIAKEMPKLIKAAQATLTFLNKDCGIYSNAEMVSHNLFIPITSIFYKLGNNISDPLKNEMRCFVYRALIFSLFEKSTTSILQKLKEAIYRMKPGDQHFIKHLDDVIINKCFGDFYEGESQWLGNEVQDIMELKKGAKTQMILLLLMQEPANMNTNMCGDDVPTYEQDHLVADHLFRKSSIKALNRDEKGKFGIRKNQEIVGNRLLSKGELNRWKSIINKKKNLENKDKLPNLWLLRSDLNESKGETLLNYWYEDLPADLQKNFWENASLPKGDLDYLKITNFEKLYKDRSEILQKKLRKLLSK